jgi:hypothetical protein
MSKPHDSGHNDELVHWDEKKTKAQAETSKASGKDQQTILEREMQRERETTARPGGAERVANEQVIAAEGLGGGADLKPDEVAGDRTDNADPILTSGMGGAGGGDIDDLGDQGSPRREDPERLTIQRPTSGMGGAGGGDLDDLGSVSDPGED